jgi:hypothetical protein
MAVSSQPVSISYSTDGIATSYAFPYYFCAKTDLFVQYTDSLGNVTNPLFNSAYTVQGTLDPHLNTYANGGTVVFAVPLAAAGTLLIIRQTPLIQPAVFEPQDPFESGSFEAQLDRQMLSLQELWAAFTRG